MNFIRKYFDIATFLNNRFLDGIYQNINKITKCISLFSDEFSKNLYESEIIYLILRNYVKHDMAALYAGLMSEHDWKKALETAKSNDYLPGFEFYPEAKSMIPYFFATTFLLEQYKYNNKVTISEGDTVFDCGGCLGDTAIWMMNQKAKRVFTFEIDKENIKYIKINKQKFNYNDSIVIEEFAVSSSNEILYYLPNKFNAGAGRIIPSFADGSYEVKSIRLDDFCLNKDIIPDFIKMDIEGGEIEALKGAKNIIKKFKPKLAICIYHSWEDRFNIPILIHDICPEYKFYLKKSNPYVETVLFCTIEREREKERERERERENASSDRSE